MDMTGEQRIAASRDAVWQALNDADILRQCIPGADTVERVSDTEFAATAAFAIQLQGAGPVGAAILDTCADSTARRITFRKLGKGVCRMQEGPPAVSKRLDAEKAFDVVLFVTEL